MDAAHAFFDGSLNPEEYAALKLDGELLKAVKNGKLPFEHPEDEFGRPRIYSAVFEHARELRRMGLPVNLHTATLTPLPIMNEVTEVPSRVEAQSSGSPPRQIPSVQGYGQPVDRGHDPVLLQSSSIFRYRGQLYPQSLNGHLHVRIPLKNLEAKAQMAHKIAQQLDLYAKKPVGSYKTQTREDYAQLAQTATRKAGEMEVLTTDLLELLDLDQLRNHPGAVTPNRHSGLSNARDRKPR